MTKGFNSRFPLLERRVLLTDRLIATLSNLDRNTAVAILASYIELDRLGDIVEFQESRRRR